MDFIVDLGNEAIPIQDLEGNAFCANPQTDTQCSCSNSGKANWDRCLTLFPNDLSLYQERTETLLNNIWERFRKKYSQVKTNGFSIIATSPWHLTNRSSTMSSIYGTDFPNILNLHLYNRNAASVTSTFNIAKTLTGGNNIIIGETYYNDINQAMAFRDAQIASGANIDFIIQWPKSFADGYDHQVPYSFKEYELEGF